MKNLKYWLEAKELNTAEGILAGAKEMIESGYVFVADNGAPTHAADGKLIWTPDRIQAYFVVGSPWYMDAETQQPLKHKRFLTRAAVALNTLVNLTVLNNSGINDILIRCKGDIYNLIETTAKADTKNHLVSNGDGWKLAVEKCFNGDDIDIAILYLLSTDDSNSKIKIPSPNFDKMLGAGFEKEYEALREKLSDTLVENVSSDESKETKDETKTEPIIAASDSTDAEIKSDAIKETINDLSNIEKSINQSLDEISKIASETTDEILDALKENSPSASPTYTSGAGSVDSGMSTLGKVAVGVGCVAGAAVIGYGLYKAYNALFVDTEITSGNFNGGSDNILGL